MYITQTNSEVKYLFIVPKMLSNVVYLVWVYVAQASLGEAELWPHYCSFLLGVADKSNAGPTFFINTLRVGNDERREKMSSKLCIQVYRTTEALLTPPLNDLCFCDCRPLDPYPRCRIFSMLSFWHKYPFLTLGCLLSHTYTLLLSITPPTNWWANWPAWCCGQCQMMHGYIVCWCPYVFEPHQSNL